MLPPLDLVLALLSLALMHCAFWPGPALTSAAVRNRAAQQVSFWLSALRQPARHRAAPRCHTPSPPGFLSFGSQYIISARASSHAHFNAIDDSTSRGHCSWFTALHSSGTIPYSHTKGVLACTGQMLVIKARPVVARPPMLLAPA
jgi:hypothetical protein